MLGDVKSGIQILMWAGDADFFCNYVGEFGLLFGVSCCYGHVAADDR